MKCRWKRGCFAKPGVDLGVLVGAVVIDDQVQVELVGELAVERAQELQELLVAVARQALADDAAVERVQRGEQRGGAVALVVVGHRAGAAPFIGRLGWVRSSAWIWLFSSTHSTSAFSGGLR